MTQTATEFTLAQIGQIAVTAQDLGRAVAFYRDTLGMPFLFQAPGLAFFNCAGVRLMLSEPEGSQSTHHASIIYYKVDDIQQAYSVLSGRGVAFRDAPHVIAVMPDHELWMVFFNDSEGNTLGLMSEVRLR